MGHVLTAQPVNPDQLVLKRVSLNSPSPSWSCYQVHPTPLALVRNDAEWYIGTGFQAYYLQSHKNDWDEWRNAHRDTLDKVFPSRKAALLTLQALLATTENAPPALIPRDELKAVRRGNGTYLLEGASLRFVLRPANPGWEARQIMEWVEDIDAFELSRVSTKVGVFASLWEAGAELQLVDMGHVSFGSEY